MPTVGRPLASTIQTPRRAASCRAALVRGVMIFSLLVSVPSRSSARTLYFIFPAPGFIYAYCTLNIQIVQAAIPFILTIRHGHDKILAMCKGVAGAAVEQPQHSSANIMSCKALA